MSHVTVYSKTTGEKQRVPEKWLDHPVLGKDFERTPSTRARRGDQPTSDHAGTPAGVGDPGVTTTPTTHESPSGGEEE